MIASIPFPAAPGRRPAALAVTVALHVLLATAFLLRQPERRQDPSASWIEMIQVRPAQPAAAPAAPPPVRTPKPPASAQARPQSPVRSMHVPVAPREPVTGIVFPEAPAAKQDTFELARAAAGSADKALRKQFPERALLRHVPRTEQQKLEDGIASAIRAPTFYEPARITKVQDQGVGYGRRIEKVQTAWGTYCITHEGNHGGDGRDVFKDALQPKMRTCPREK